MLLRRRFSTLALSLTILFSVLFLGGCSEKPFLSEDGSYVILTVSPSGMTQSEVIQLPWNSNMAVMQNLLDECSFVLSDLHTPSSQELASTDPATTISLQATFPQPKRMTLVVDKHPVTLDVESLQIEVEGANVGRVTINRTMILQGINDSNLQPAFQELEKILHDQNS
ncbi:hypothetical protein Desaci_3126 [Desulfosporosinus acidiphilus SJ4]|uniref:Uncharacterized protein n=1 Tax=Desulfosporosinus acidiphilus (strain DSM 22704 / JCM 16185 / SJ4) TaxID=646529 RepID=I4D8A6_DESAJ|nr:hypothetical protein [Desulfosporosinus acidiphilus]AFM42030.1 hypothetical protein Desaci_3126 [Desulfosporosinus acidiphilus SJ4]